MRTNYLVLIGLGVVILLITSALAMYYRHQAVCFQREWSAAVAQLSRIAAEPVTPQALATPKVEAKLKTPAAQTKADDAGLIRTQRPELERQPAETDKPAPPPAVTMPQRSPGPERPRRRNSDWMENLRATDPQRYEEMQQRRREMQQYLQNAWVQTTNYFTNRDTSKMTDPEVEEFNMMVALLGETRALSQQLQSGLPPDARREVVSAVRSNMLVLAPLLDNERNREFYDLAVAMGQIEADAAAFVGYVNQITSNTSLRTILPGIMRGGLPGNRPSGTNSPGSVPPAN